MAILGFVDGAGEADDLDTVEVDTLFLGKLDEVPLVAAARHDGYLLVLPAVEQPLGHPGHGVPARDAQALELLLLGEQVRHHVVPDLEQREHAVDLSAGFAGCQQLT